MIKSCVFHTPIAPSYFRNNRSTRQKSLRCFPMCSSRGHVNGGFCGQSIRTTMILTNQTSTETLNPATENNLLQNPENTAPPSDVFSPPEIMEQKEDGVLLKTNPIDINDYIIIMEIRPSLTPRISQQKFVKKQEILSQLRTKHEKSSLEKELFLGEIDILTATSSASSVSSSYSPPNDDATRNEIKLYVTFNSNHSSWDYSWKSNRWLGPNEFHVVDIVVLKYYNPTEFQVYSSFVSSPFIIVSSHKKSNIGVSLSSSIDINENGEAEEEEQARNNEQKEIFEHEEEGGGSELKQNHKSGGGVVGGEEKTKKGNTKKTQKKRAYSTISTQSYSADDDIHDVIEGAQLLSNLSGNLINLPTKGAPLSEELDELPEGMNWVSNSSDQNNLIHLPSSSSLPNSALAVAMLPTPPLNYNPSKKIAIMHDKHLRSYEVHYPDLTLIEEVRMNALQIPKRRKTIRNHIQLPEKENFAVESSSLSPSKRVGDGTLVPSNTTNSSSSAYRNHRQLPDKDPNYHLQQQQQYQQGGSSASSTGHHDLSLEDSANQLLLLSSKETILEAQAREESITLGNTQIYGTDVFITNGTMNHSGSHSSESSRNRKQTKQTRRGVAKEQFILTYLSDEHHHGDGHYEEEDEEEEEEEEEESYMYPTISSDYYAAPSSLTIDLEYPMLQTVFSDPTVSNYSQNRLGNVEGKLN